MNVIKVESYKSYDEILQALSTINFKWNGGRKVTKDRVLQDSELFDNFNEGEGVALYADFGSERLFVGPISELSDNFMSSAHFLELVDGIIAITLAHFEA